MPKPCPALPHKCILVVDDEQLVCDAIRMMLNFDGHVVETTSNPKDALAKIEQRSYDLVITDFAMPAMRGDELAAAIKSRRPGQPVALITAYAEMLQSTHREMPGVDFVISKPFLLENLRQAIAKATSEKTEADAIKFLTRS